MFTSGKTYTTYVLCTLFFLSFLLHFRIFTLDLIGPHVWRQTQTQATILNFAREDMNILNPRINGKADTDRISRGEFPLMQWSFAWFYKAFGNHIIITRILCFLIGICTVLGMFHLFSLLFQDTFIAALGAWAFNFSPLFFYYTMNPLPDMLALCFGIWGISIFVKSQSSDHSYSLWISGILLALATAVKLPYILFSVFPVVQLLRQFRPQPLQTIRKLILLELPNIISVCWYAWVIPQWKNQNVVVAGMLNNKRSNAELLEIIWGHLISTLPELLINYGAVAFFATGMYLILRKDTRKNIHFLSLAAWGMATIFYLLFELNAIGKEHDYYLLPFLPLIFVIITAAIKWAWIKQQKIFRFIVLFILLVLPLTAFLRIDSRWNPQKPSLNLAVYENKEELRKLVPQNALCIVGNDVSQHILLYYIDKKGFVFDNDLLDGTILHKYINLNAEYLFTDSRSDEKEDVRPMLEEKIFDKGNFRVYRLKKSENIE